MGLSVGKVSCRGRSHPADQWRKPFWNIRIWGAVIGFGLLAGAGCGDGKLKTYPVSGQLRFADGSAPMFGEVEFFNAEHRLNARGKVHRDGTFTVGTYQPEDGAVAGRHKIVVIQQVGSPLATDLESQIDHDHGELIHPDYLDYRTSELECVIEPGENRVELTVRGRVIPAQGGR